MEKQLMCMKVVYLKKKAIFRIKVICITSTIYIAFYFIFVETHSDVGVQGDMSSCVECCQ